MKTITLAILTSTTLAAPVPWDNGQSMKLFTDEILSDWKSVQNKKALDTNVSAENIAKIDPKIVAATDGDGKTYDQYVIDLAKACKTENSSNPGRFTFDYEACKASTGPKAEAWLAQNVWRAEFANAMQAKIYDRKVANLKLSGLKEEDAIEQAYFAVFYDPYFDSDLYNFDNVVDSTKAPTKAPSTNNKSENRSKFLGYSAALLAAYAVL